MLKIIFIIIIILSFLGKEVKIYYFITILKFNFYGNMIVKVINETMRK